MPWQKSKRVIAAATLSICMLLLTACAMDDIKSSNIQTCQKAVDSILLGSDDGINKMEDAINSGKANTGAIIDRLFVIESDPSSAEKFNGKTEGILLDIYYGKMGDEARKIFESDPRNAIMFDSIMKNFNASRDYNIKELSNITTPSMIEKILNYYITGAEQGGLNEVFKRSKLNDTFLNFWEDYYKTNGLEKMGAGYEALKNALSTASFKEYEKPVSYVYQVNDNRDINGILNYIEYGGSDIWGNVDTSKLDRNKVAIIDAQYRMDGSRLPDVSLSPYSFILVPKEKCLSSEDLTNAGTMICIGRKITQGGTYTPLGLPVDQYTGIKGVKAYSQSATIYIADRIKKTITIVRMLNGTTLGDNITVQPGVDTYLGSPPAEEDIIMAIQQALKQ